MHASSDRVYAAHAIYLRLRKRGWYNCYNDFHDKKHEKFLLKLILIDDFEIRLLQKYFLMKT